MNTAYLLLSLALTGQSSFVNAFDAPISAGNVSALSEAKTPAETKAADDKIIVRSTSSDEDMAALNAKIDRLAAAIEATASKKSCECNQQQTAGTTPACPTDCNCATPGACGHDGCACVAKRTKRRVASAPQLWQLRDLDGKMYQHADKDLLESWMDQHNQELAAARTQVVPRQVTYQPPQTQYYLPAYQPPTYQPPQYEMSYGGGFNGGGMGGGFMSGLFGGSGCGPGGCR